MARKTKFNDTKQITTVTYFSNTARPARMLATFPGHLSVSEVERQFLFSKHIPRRCIQFDTVEHKFI
jgi:hypothetical protein